MPENKSILELALFQKKFNTKFKTFFAYKKKQIAKIAPSSRLLLEVLEEFAFRSSKRIRPALVCYGYKAAGGKDLGAVLEISQSVELFHTFALIHDDLIDQSTLRRGKPTVDRILEKNAPRHLIDKKHFGLSSAILVGDLVFTFADEIFTTSHFASKTTKSAKGYYDLLRNEVVVGQYLDMQLADDFSANKKKILEMLILKSGKYTIERPLHIGAALASAPNSIFQAYTNYGIPLGLAFQLQDDVLGIFGDEKITGKPADSDLKDGKNTLILALTMEKANINDKKLLEKVVGNQNATKDDFNKVKQIIVNSKALDETKSEIQKQILKAKKSLLKVKLETQSKQFLLGIADYIGNRIN